MVNNSSGKGHTSCLVYWRQSASSCVYSFILTARIQERNSSIYVPVLTKHRDNGSLATFCNIGPPSPPFSAPHQHLLSSQSQATRRATSTSSHQSTIHLHFSSSHGTGPLSDRILHFLNVKKEKFRELLLRRRERVTNVCSSSAQSSRTQVGTTHLYVLKVSLRREYIAASSEDQKH